MQHIPATSFSIESDSGEECLSLHLEPKGRNQIQFDADPTCLFLPNLLWSFKHVSRFSGWIIKCLVICICIHIYIYIYNSCGLYLQIYMHVYCLFCSWLSPKFHCLHCQAKAVIGTEPFQGLKSGVIRHPHLHLCHTSAIVPSCHPMPPLWTPTNAPPTTKPIKQGTSRKKTIKQQKLTKKTGLIMAYHFHHGTCKRFTAADHRLQVDDSKQQSFRFSKFDLQAQPPNLSVSLPPTPWPITWKDCRKKMCLSQFFGGDLIHFHISQLFPTNSNEINGNYPQKSTFQH